MQNPRTRAHEVGRKRRLAPATTRDSLGHAILWLGPVLFILLFVNVARGLGGEISGVWWTYTLFLLLVGGSIWWEAHRYRQEARRRVLLRRELGIRATKPPKRKRRLRFPLLRRVSQRARIERVKPGIGTIAAVIGVWAMVIMTLVACGLMLMKIVG